MFVLWPDITVDLSPQFAGPIDLRDFLPTFQGNAIALGTLPDPTFGGMIGDLSPDNAESLLGKYFRMLPVGYPPELSITNTVNVTFKTLLGHYYVLETSTNLSRWDVAAQFTAAGSWSTLVDPQPPGMTKRFYRLRDDTGFMIFTGVVFDQATSLPITGAQVYCAWGSRPVVRCGGANPLPAARMVPGALDVVRGRRQQRGRLGRPDVHDHGAVIAPRKSPPSVSF